MLKVIAMEEFLGEIQLGELRAQTSSSSDFHLLLELYRLLETGEGPSGTADNGELFRTRYP